MLRMSRRVCSLNLCTQKHSNNKITFCISYAAISYPAGITSVLSAVFRSWNVVCT